MTAELAGAARPGVLRRLASMSYESLLVGALLLVLFVLPHVLIAALTALSAPPGVLWSHVFLVLLAYFVGFWTHGGQTPAMKTWRLRVVGGDGRAVTLRRALLRYLVAWPSVALAGVGLAWALCDRDRLFLHDRIAGTRLRFEPIVDPLTRRDAGAARRQE